MLLIPGGFFAGLFLIELGVRLATHSLFLLGVQSNRYVIRDPIVGRIPVTGISIHLPQGFTITTGEHGIRLNGSPTPQIGRPLTLVVGDSFAFSDQVNDEDSWPAVLERLSARPVLNAGVPGYGLDQTVLRAEQLAPIYAPDTIIVSFIPHDVLRCEMSYWSGHAKPYFDIDGSGLRWHPAPVSTFRYATLKRILSLSVPMDLLFPRFLNWEGPEVMVVHHHGREVACRLMARLAALASARNLRVVVLAQPQQPSATPEQLAIKDGLLACAEANRLRVLDLFSVIEPLPLDQRARLFHRHMTVEGNRLVASTVATFLNQ